MELINTKAILQIATMTTKVRKKTEQHKSLRLIRIFCVKYLAT